MLVGRLLSFWDGLFSGAMLVSGRVITRSFLKGARFSPSLSTSFPVFRAGPKFHDPLNKTNHGFGGETLSNSSCVLILGEDVHRTMIKAKHNFWEEVLRKQH